ncbi:DoxX family protein [Flavobacteriaceae bacterium]|jgi:Na+-transporting NADH:ubiquinone oxidoreductase subunit NqrD|nr:DoxX family protein [Flavobacteriaceae bacterium]|tara:strand:- start:3133 stop:3519 length:387 start_codon:yes stop_codon:yes gene_type:complete
MNKMLKNLSKVLSVFVGLTIINVWLFRSNRSTSYRGGDATNLIEEFAVYGLEDYFLIIGIIKVSLAIILILSLYYNKLRLFASLGIAIMMLVAINMHMSVGDELIKLTPAATMLISSLLIVYSTKNSK